MEFFYFLQSDLILVLIQHALFVTDSAFLVFRAASVLAVEPIPSRSPRPIFYRAFLLGPYGYLYETISKNL